MLRDQPAQNFRTAVVWGRGGKEQEEDVQKDNEGGCGKWWPIIFSVQEYVQGRSLCGCYCPGLAWADGRPWLVHLTRVRLVHIPDDLFGDFQSDTAAV